MLDDLGPLPPLDSSGMSFLKRQDTEGVQQSRPQQIESESKLSSIRASRSFGTIGEIEENDGRVNVIMFGTGEYTTGFVNGSPTKSDKSAGDLRRRKVVNRLAICGTRGTKFPQIREHLKRVISDKYVDMDVSMESFPSDDVSSDSLAYLDAINSFKPGDAAIIFTPDDTHYDIAMACIRKGLHVLVSKPLVMNLFQHKSLMTEAKLNGVLVAMEVHKRYDPIYTDAYDRIRSGQLGDFSFFSSYMSQPKTQKATFNSWIGSSDISYYLNAHHIDFHVACQYRRSRPVLVSALSSKSSGDGIGKSTTTMIMIIDDTITLSVKWENRTPSPSSFGIAIYTSSWIAPTSDVHSQQRFHYMGQSGEVIIDQAHRGYSIATDGDGYRSLNPLFMKYTADDDGRFAGQGGYGYRSLESFINKVASPSSLDFMTRIDHSLQVTAVFEAGRRSLDNDNLPVSIMYEDETDAYVPTGLTLN